MKKLNLKDDRGFLDFNLIVLIFLAFVVISFIIAFESWRSKQRAVETSAPAVRETTVEIGSRSDEAERWLGEAVNRCLASPDCELERDGSRVVFRGIDAGVIASDVPDGVRIIRTERPVPAFRPRPGMPAWHGCFRARRILFFIFPLVRCLPLRNSA